MKHTIICWDCSFRNFFHTIDALIEQDYNKNQFELIYVEQRKKEVANDYNHELGLKSLEDRYNEVKNEINFTLIYLDDDKSIPYHLGKCVNKGITEARGEIISVMDGDLLMPSNFLQELEEAHKKDERVYNLHRKMAQYPIGVSKDNWMNAEIGFDKCLEACSNEKNDIPKKVSNKGPMISAKKEYWNEVGGYDNHLIWSTGLSRLGQDVTKRLEIFLGKESKALQNVFSVHPFHPSGFSRSTIKSDKMLKLQKKLIDWSIKHNEFSWKKRIDYTNNLFEKNKDFLNEMIFDDFLMSKGEFDSSTNNVLDSLKEKGSIFINKFLKKLKN